jgi:uncharacterized membrane protein YphA (DoxX/SURF4 family)
MNALIESTHVKQVRDILKYTYGIVPIVAGLDKFPDLLTNWDKYLHPLVAGIIPASVFMSIVGIIEIIAGLLVFTKTRLGALIVSLWLVAISLNLIFSGSYLDVAVRDLVMAIGAFSLFKLSENTKVL